MKLLQAQAKKGKLNGFNDQSISTGVFFINLLAAIEPDVVDPNLVTEGLNDDDKLLNAKYAISIARKLGAVIFLLPEDIVEVRPKMCLTFAAAVMALKLQAK
jgi:plastin-1